MCTVCDSSVPKLTMHLRKENNEHGCTVHPPMKRRDRNATLVVVPADQKKEIENRGCENWRMGVKRKIARCDDSSWKEWEREREREKERLVFCLGNLAGLVQDKSRSDEIVNWVTWEFAIRTDRWRDTEWTKLLDTTVLDFLQFWRNGNLQWN